MPSPLLPGSVSSDLIFYIFPQFSTEINIDVSFGSFLVTFGNFIA